jgi:predicted flap endonuclease-1-like 5' DNA nuclease
MDRLITILRAAHCRSTHQYFVLDALPLIKTDSGRRLGSQLLKHYHPYLVGAKAPDKEFRDFRNHVIHVQDNHWGGAATTAQKWYEQLVQSIRRSNWSEAAYNAGVLSHYFTDPLMPLHTAQSDIESVVHRPLEWSVTKSYERILNRYHEGGHRVFFETSHGAGWLAEAVTKGAELSNRHYEELMRRYNLGRGTRRPQEGFDEESIEILAGLFGIALTGWAHIVERAAIDANIEIPKASLTVSSVVAAITMPVGWILRRIESASEQKAVKAIFEEFRNSGTITENLPDEIKVVRQERERDRAAAFEAKTPDTIPITRPTKSVQPAVSSSETVVARAQPPAKSVPAFRLAMTDDLVDAPSIGPKTAQRFAKIGITTVAQFLEASPATMADQLRTRWIKTETLVDWQDQARLVATVPGLCGYKAQLLVGAECRDCHSLSRQEASSLHQQVEAFATSKAGRRVLRSNKLPTVEDVTEWISNAADSPQRRSA